MLCRVACRTAWAFVLPIRCPTFHVSSEEFVGLHSLFAPWIAAMRSHESYEERKLYPYLEYRWGVSLNDARTGHAELHPRADDVVEAHDRTLDVHLNVEDEAVVPLLLALDPEEFDRYLAS